ncbi:YqgQ family protein [Virgibacillus sp. YIM 98842]|uniref:YqgQ family protein n=1 Tax=Virgibacillus sp. YIM 98842 TaxID=2663533 RepID=UPI0013DC0BA7|nr:YqgQ family protein [Virgibacillus sp. YIM 98842]
MKSVYEIQNLLMKFGSVIYTGNRIGDLELMESELEELFHYQMINSEEYTQAKLLLKKEITRLSNEKR